MTKEINLDRSTLNLGFVISILSILAIASLAYTRYRLGFISDDELGNSGNIAVFYLLRILTFLTSVASVSLWLFFIWLFKRNQPRL